MGRRIYTGWFRRRYGRVDACQNSASPARVERVNICTVHRAGDDAGAITAEQGDWNGTTDRHPRWTLTRFQGDVLIGMQKKAELFIFFKIADAARFRSRAREYVAGRLTTPRTAQERDRQVYESRRQGASRTGDWLGFNFGFSKDGLTQLLGPARPHLDLAFERGAQHSETIAALDDPPLSKWTAGLSVRSDRRRVF